MKAVKRWITATTIMTMLFASVGTDLNAQGGSGYYDGSNAASISPEWAFGGLLALSLIVVALQNSNSGHTH